jgi:hypothetical protein
MKNKPDSSGLDPGSTTAPENGKMGTENGDIQLYSKLK